MYSPLQLGLKYIHYYATASNGKGHGVHSPFVFSFITKVLNDKRHFYAYESIESVRQLLLLENKQILIEEFGAGSRVNKTRLRSIHEIASSSLKPKKFGQLLFRMADVFSPKNILELGTSLGITTAYLAAANPTATIVTLEGSIEIAEIARANFERLNLHNVQQVIGNFDDTLSTTLSTFDKVDMVFIDGNHRYEPTVRYFHQLLPLTNEYSILIFDDIHWSHEMEMAWEEIIHDPSVTLTIDLFFIGLVFFRKENKATEHFKIRF